MHPIHQNRKDYTQSELSETACSDNPFIQFEHWFNEAQKTEVHEAHAMTLATANKHGQPSARIVLLKHFDAQGFCWFTDYRSKKAQDLIDKPYASLLFYWPSLERQIRIEGGVGKVSAAESDQYFASRPVASQLSALTSTQSAVIDKRTSLEKKYQQIEEQFADPDNVNNVLMRPNYWGGYRLTPNYFEFWQGRPSRLHDRLCFQLQTDAAWLRLRLQP